MITEQKKELVDRMNTLIKLIPDTVKATNDLPDDINGSLYTLLDPGELRITMDYIPQQYLATRRILARQWEYKEHRFNNRTGCYYVTLCHRKLEVELVLELGMPIKFEEGTKCKIVEVGHRTEIIYGLECK